ncbi:MAG: hypothetical protein KDA80_18000 [Planctomycetaceae bacterium]|nr:hypothetical protein [Planctomycetaceae bacterium]
METTLKSFNLSSEVCVTFKAETQEFESDFSGNPLVAVYSRDIEYCLAFKKYQGEWRVCYTSGETGDPGSFSFRPILDCSLDERKLALEGIPQLLEAVVEKAESDSSSLETALGAAAEALSSIKRVAK